MTSKITPEQAQMAAELALGVLEGQERAEALRLSLTNPAFAAMVAQWQGQLDSLGEGFEEAPPPDLWRAIETRLDAEPQAGTIHKLRLWKGLAAALGALAAGLAVIIVLGPATIREASDLAAPADPASVVIAQLTGIDGTLLAANIDPQGQFLEIRAIALPDTQLTPELWVISGDGVPRSLGPIARSGTTQVRLPANLRPLVNDGAVLAVSLELAEGAPHAAPSSTPIATGNISAI